MDNDPLLALVVDAVEVNRQRIAEALRNVIAIDKSGQVLPAQRFSTLSASGKILAFLLGRKVAVLLDLADDEAIGPTELAKLTGMAEGTVYPTVRQLNGDRLISQGSESGYYLAPHQVTGAIDVLGGDGDERDGEPSSTGRRTPRRRRGTQRKARASDASTDPKQSERVSDTDEGASEEQPAKPRRASSGFSPTNAIRALVGQGFFAEPRTLTDLQREFKDRQAHDIPATTLSPIMTRLLRSGVVERRRREDEGYEYTAKSLE